MSQTPPLSPAKTCASVIVAALFCGIFTLDIIFHFLPEVLGGFLGGAVWPILAFIGGPIGTYRGCLALNWAKPVTAVFTIVSILPPVAFVIHVVLLVRLTKTKAATSA